MALKKAARLFGVAASGTQYSDEIHIPEGAELGIVIAHPASTSTTYTFEVSNNNDADKKAGFDVWGDYELRDGAGTVLPQKTSAENFTVTISPPYLKGRIKAVTASGSGQLNAWVNTVSRK